MMDEAYGEKLVGSSTCHEWFAKWIWVREKKTHSHNDKPLEFESDELKALLDEDPNHSSLELAEKLGAQSLSCNMFAKYEEDSKGGKFILRCIKLCLPHLHFLPDMEKKQTFFCQRLLLRARVHKSFTVGSVITWKGSSW